MKKKVLHQFYQKYTPAEELLFITCREHFKKLKKENLVIIPFSFIVNPQQETHLLSLQSLKNDPQLSFIEQFWEKGRSLQQNKLTFCFAVCFDAHVFDEDNIDKDALVLLLQKEDDTKVQVNIPYVEDDGEVVFGEDWVVKSFTIH